MNGILNKLQQVALGKLGIKELNAMQSAAVTHCRENGSMVLLSPTGTGKTLAFLLPLLERLNIDEKGVQDLAKTPSKEVLIGKMLGSLQSSLYSFAYVLQAIIDKSGEAPVAEEAPVVEITEVKVEEKKEEVCNCHNGGVCTCGDDCKCGDNCNCGVGCKCKKSKKKIIIFQTGALPPVCITKG